MEQELRNTTWAFAKRVPLTPNRKRLAATRRSVITACSYQAKQLGIRAGMRYEEAKTLVPNIKILVIGGRNV